jgi:hypothetical protein
MHRKSGLPDFSLFARTNEERLGGPCFFSFFLRLARETLPPQFMRALAHALNGFVILRHGLRRVSFLLLARFEKALGAVLVLMLGHVHSTHQAVESSGSLGPQVLVSRANDLISARDQRRCAG